MPVSTRQPTPGPSNAVLHSATTKKRSGDDAHDDARSAKKIKVDGDAARSHISSVNGKDKKKKNRRKKKRRSSVVMPVPHPQPRQGSRSKSRSVPPSTIKQTAVLLGIAQTGAPADDEDMESVLSASDKGKGRASPDSPAQRSTTLPSDSPPSEAMGAGSSVMVVASQIESAAQGAEIARLKEQLAAQTKLLERHQTHFSNHQQTLTCQICLDLMHRPYALAPCGHTTCYPCLVRWFTAAQNPEGGGNPVPDNTQTIDALLDSASARSGTFVRRKKKCPVCRAVVIDRPVEMWAIKSMVAALVRSGLGDLPVPLDAPAAEEGANTDPWRNVFRKSGTGHRFGGVFEALFGPPAEPPAQADGDRERMGWYDAEDGGIYRCIACYHEIWDGVCSSCRRRYPGHGEGSDDEDDDEDGDVPVWGPIPNHFWPGPEIFDDSDDMEEDEGGDEDEDEDDDGLPHLHLHPPYLPQHHLAAFYPELAAQPMQGHIEEVDDEEADEENSEYEGSFIDDENGDHGDIFEEDDDDEVEVLDRLVLPPPRNHFRRQVLFDDDGEGEEDDDDEDEDEDPMLLARLLGRGTRMGNAARNMIFDASDSESDGSIEVVEDVHDDGEGNDEEGGSGQQSSPPPRRRHQRRLFLDD